jgi:hypothetical protein
METEFRDTISQVLFNDCGKLVYKKHWRYYNFRREYVCVARAASQSSKRQAVFRIDSRDISRKKNRFSVSKCVSNHDLRRYFQKRVAVATTGFYWLLQNNLWPAADAENFDVYKVFRLLESSRPSSKTLLWPKHFLDFSTFHRFFGKLCRIFFPNINMQCNYNL